MTQTMMRRSVKLVPMGRVLLDVLATKTPSAARGLVDYQLPELFSPEDKELFALRRDQMDESPEWEEWLLRAIVHRESSTMVGYANFHGPPGVNDAGVPGAVSIGYTIFPEFRCRGYATHASALLLEWARVEHGVTHVVCGVLPDNAASIRVLEKSGFRRTHRVVEGESIWELNPEPRTAS